MSTSPFSNHPKHFIFPHETTQRYPAATHAFLTPSPLRTLATFEDEQSARNALLEHTTMIADTRNDYAVCIIRKASERENHVVFVPKGPEVLMTEVVLRVEKVEVEVGGQKVEDEGRTPHAVGGLEGTRLAFERNGDGMLSDGFPVDEACMPILPRRSRGWSIADDCRTLRADSDRSDFEHLP